MKVGRRQVDIPWWRVLWMRLKGDWEPFLAYVAAEDARDQLCPICGATEGQKCDAGLHS